ncbi:MAG: hypothetical protein NVS2B7_00820 [Herpetosiphon sp.]
MQAGHIHSHVHAPLALHILLGPRDPASVQGGAIISTAAENAATARAVYDAFNHDDFDRALSYMSDDAEVAVYPQGLSLRGRAGFREMMQRHKAPWPDGRVEVLRQLAADDGVTNECLYHATHPAPLPMPDGSTVPPTNRTLELRFCEVWRFKDGKIVSLDNYGDNLPLLQQLGLMPTAEQTTAQ